MRRGAHFVTARQVPGDGTLAGDERFPYVNLR